MNPTKPKLPMKTVRYFRDKDSYWKFESGKPPLTKTGFYSSWRASYFKTVEEFLSDPVKVREVGIEEAEEARVISFEVG